MNVPVLATTQPVKRRPNILENKIQQNADDIGTGDTSGTYSKQCWYLHHQRFISPLPVKPGGGGFLTVCHSVRPYVRLSVYPSVHSVSVHSFFRTFHSRPLTY